MKIKNKKRTVKAGRSKEIKKRMGDKEKEEREK
jgi:hypothetical protein